MTPKQKRLRQLQRRTMMTSVKRYMLGIILLAGVIKILSLGLQMLQGL